MPRFLPLLAALLLPLGALAADKETAATDAPAVEAPDTPGPPPRTANEVIDDAKDATNAAIDAAKEALIQAIEAAKTNTAAKLDEGKKASEDALDKAHDATTLLDKAAQAAREVLDKAKQATSEVFEKAKEAAKELGAGEKSTEASPAPKSEGPRDPHEPPSETQKWH